MATDSKAKFSGLAAKLKGPRGFIVAMVFLLVVRLFFVMQEVGGSNIEVPSPTNYTPKYELQSGDAVYQDVQQLLKARETLDKSKEFATIRDLNMFDWRDVANAPQMEEKANELYNQALQLFSVGDAESLAKAQQLVNEALRINPSNQKCQDLQVRISEQLKTAAGTGATTGTATN
jgi:hypothetical protein